MLGCHQLGHQHLISPLSLSSNATPAAAVVFRHVLSLRKGESYGLRFCGRVAAGRFENLWRSRAAERSSLSVESCMASKPVEKEEDLLNAAVQAVERACQLCLNVRSKLEGSDDGGKGEGRLEKGDQTPVTIADFGVQALITLELGTRFPFPLVGEEDARQLRDSAMQELGQSPGEGGRGRTSLVDAVVDEVRRAASVSIVDRVSVDGVLDALDGKTHGSEGAAERTDETTSGTYWVLDPIDGTRGFLRGGEAQYVVGLALVRDGSVVLGVMGCPNLPLDFAGVPSLRDESRPPERRGAIIAAARGCGTWLSSLPSGAGGGGARTGVSLSEELPEASVEAGGAGGRRRRVRVRVTGEDDLWDARICISDHEAWEDLPLSRSWEGGDAPDQLPLCCGSLCKYAAVAVGAASVFVQHPLPGKPKLKVWDHAAGVICVTEAGGSVTDFSGSPLELTNEGGREFSPAGEGVVVSNGRLHSRVLRALTESLA